MRNRLVVLFALFFIVFISCQKEIDWGLTADTEKILARIISKSPTDSTVIDFTYNSNRQLVQEATATIGAASFNNDLKIFRTASGVITKTKQVSSTLQAQGIDSIITNYTYNAGTSRYSYSIMTMTIAGTTLVDSTVFIYDASGNISADEHYMTTGIIPTFLNLRNQYTYSADGLNLTSVQQLVAMVPGGPLTPLSTQSFTFDAKKSPLVLKQEAILLLRPNYFNAKNISNLVFTNTADPSQDFTMGQSFQYNTSNKPDSATSTRNPGGVVTKSKYFYQ